MSLDQSLPWFDHMSVSEQVLLLQDLWDRLAADPEQIETTPRQRDELDERLTRHRARPEEVSTWKEAKRRIRSAG